jgi:hypothetical protein
MNGFHGFHHSELHLFGIIYINRVMTPVQVYNNGYRQCGFRCGDGNNENCKKYAPKGFRIQVAVKSHKIDIDTIQDQLNCHEHCDHISPREQAVHANAEKGCAQEQYMAQRDLMHSQRFGLFQIR